MTTFTHLSQPPEPDDDDSQELDLGAFDQDGDPIDWTARYRPGDQFWTTKHLYEVVTVSQEEITIKKHLTGIPGGGQSAVKLYLKPWNFETMIGLDFVQAKFAPQPTAEGHLQMTLPDVTRTIKKPGQEES